jgi:hypothetical protein
MVASSFKKKFPSFDFCSFESTSNEMKKKPHLKRKQSKEQIGRERQMMNEVLLEKVN